MKADAQQRANLLKLQRTDSRIAKLAAELRSLPIMRHIQDQQQLLAKIRKIRITGQSQFADTKREIERVSADLERVSKRLEKQQGHLDRSEGNARALLALENEVEQLKGRMAELEDEQLQLLERQETIQGKLTVLEERATAEEAQLAELNDQVEEQRKLRSNEITQLEAQRSDLRAGVPSNVLSAYDQLRDGGGQAVAQLIDGRVEGVHFELSPAELHTLQMAPEDEVIILEDYGVLVVR
ncbi:MAG: hypothetical protein SOS98_06320 [Varibaculum sp.]|nr:hypothetical protein [Varibaculum sp.]